MASSQFPQTGTQADLDLMLVHNLQRTHGRLQPLLNADLRQRNLTGAQFNTLLVLQAAGPDGLPMSGIGEKLVVTKSNVTGLIRRLELQGWVRRKPGRDKREALVSLTPDGQMAIDRTVPEHIRTLSELTACLDQGEKQTLIHLLTRLRRRLRQMRETP